MTSLTRTLPNSGIIKQDEIEEGEEIARNAFAVVRKAVWNGDSICVKVCLISERQKSDRKALRCSQSMHDFSDPAAFGVSVGSSHERDIQAYLNKQRMHEVKMFSCLKHDNLIGFRGVCVDEHGKTTQIVLEHADCTLAAYLQRNNGSPFMLQELLRVAQAVANVLAYFHGQSPAVPIGNLSLQSFLVVPSSEAGAGVNVKLADVGHAKFARDIMLPFTAVDDSCAAPDTQKDCCADMFRFGTIFASIVCEHVAFTPVLETGMGYLHRFCPGLADVISRCSSRDRDTRLTAADASSILRGATIPDDLAVVHHCESLAAVCNQRLQRASLGKAHVPVLISYLSKHLSNATVVAAVLRAIVFLVANTPTNQDVLRSCEGLSAVHAALTNHPAAVDVQYHGVLAIGHCTSCNPDCQLAAVACGCLPLVTGAMANHTGSANVQVVCCWALISLGSEVASAFEALQSVCTAMARHSEHRLVQLYGCWALTAFKPSSSVTGMHFTAHTAIVSALERFIGDRDVVHRGLAALLLTGAGRGTSHFLLDQVIATHAEDTRIQRMGGYLRDVLSTV
jgi:Protein tyrosine and serine/threonine kinase